MTDRELSKILQAELELLTGEVGRLQRENAVLLAERDQLRSELDLLRSGRARGE